MGLNTELLILNACTFYYAVLPLGNISKMKYIITLLKERLQEPFPPKPSFHLEWEIEEGHIIFLQVILFFLSSVCPTPSLLSFLLGKCMLYKAGFQKGLQWV